MKTRNITSILALILSLYGTAQIPQPISMANYPSFYTQTVNSLTILFLIKQCITDN